MWLTTGCCTLLLSNARHMGMVLKANTNQNHHKLDQFERAREFIEPGW